jgi:hypothetical protein
MLIIVTKNQKQDFLPEPVVCRCSLYLVRGTPENQSQEPQLVAAVSRTGTFLILIGNISVECSDSKLIYSVHTYR